MHAFRWDALVRRIECLAGPVHYNVYATTTGNDIPLRL
jgi:hypothetical protein